MADNVLGTLFQGIAEAIRGKTGSTDKMAPAEFPERISNIVTDGWTGGVGDYRIKTGTYTATTSGKSVTITHNFGAVPDFLIISSNVAINDSNRDQYDNELIALNLFCGCSQKVYESFAAQGMEFGQAYCCLRLDGKLLWNGVFGLPIETVNGWAAVQRANATTFTVSSSFTFLPGVEYTWVAIGSNN